MHNYWEACGVRDSTYLYLRGGPELWIFNPWHSKSIGGPRRNILATPGFYQLDPKTIGGTKKNWK